MSDLYSILPSLQPDSTQVSQAELYAQTYLASLYPDTDFREGTALYDLVIRPTASMLALINNAVTSYFNENTIAGVTDNTPTTMVDQLMSNWFLSRNQGSNAVINARLFFAVQKNVQLSSSVSFSPDGSLRYFPTSTYVYSAGQMQYDPISQEYYIDVDLVSENADSSYNISAGSLLYFTNFDTFFLHAEINYLKTIAVNTETNTEFIARAKNAISTRNLINAPSIISNLQSQFPSIYPNIVSVGYADAEMQRDLVTVVSNSGYPTNIHIGGKTDIYCDNTFATNSQQFTISDSGTVILTGPIWRVTRDASSAGSSADTLDPAATWTTSSNCTGNGQDFGFSTMQELILSFGTANAGKTVSLTMDYFQYVQAVQAYLDMPNVRVLAADPMARGFNFYMLDFTIGFHSTTAPAAVSVLNVLQSYTDSLVPGQAFIMADAISALNKAGFTGMQVPLTISFNKYSRDLSVVNGTITDYLNPNDRTAIFKINTVTVNVLGS